MSIVGQAQLLKSLVGLFYALPIVGLFYALPPSLPPSLLSRALTLSRARARALSPASMETAAGKSTGCCIVLSGAEDRGFVT